MSHRFVQCIVAALALGLTLTPGLVSSAEVVAAPVGAQGTASVEQQIVTAKRKPRARLSGYYEVLPTGKLRVSVTSNAKKVTLTYHTAKNRHRTVTVRVRKGVGTRTLPAGTHALRAKARATSKLRASRTLKLGLKPLPPPAVSPPIPIQPPVVTPVPATPPDTTPPGPVTALRASSVTITSISLAWTNPSDNDLALVIVDRAGTEVCRALTTQCTDTNLIPWTDYTYRVTTQDVAGNLGAGAALTVRTRATGVVGPVQRVSTAADGSQADGPSGDAAFSPDGTRLAFDSLASNLVLGDTNGSWDVFVKTIATGEIRRVSTTSTGAQALGDWPAGDSWMPVWSPDGTQIAFYSDATNLVAEDTNGAGDVFVKNVATGHIERVSTDSAGIEGDDVSEAPTWSPDGTRIAFHSYATNLVPDDTNEAADIFVKTLASGETERIAVTGESPCWFDALNPVWSPAGDEVAFECAWGIAVRTLETDELEYLDAGGPLLGGLHWSPDGTALVATHGAYTGIDPQVVVVDPWQYVSASAEGVLANSFEGMGTDCDTGGAYFGRGDLGAAWSPDRVHVAFQNCSFNLLEEGVDTNEVADIYIKELTGDRHGPVVRASTAADGTEANGPSLWATFSPEGKRIAFESAASNLVAGDTNNEYDVFIKTLP